MSNHEKLCDQFEKEIFLFQNNELPDEKMQEWQEHLTECRTCSKKADDVLQTLSFYKNADLDDVDDIRFEQILEHATSSSSKRKWRYVGLMAAVCCFLILFIFVRNNEPKVDLSWDYKEIDQTIVEVYRQLNSIGSDKRDFKIEVDFLSEIEFLNDDIYLYKEFLLDI